MIERSFVEGSNTLHVNWNLPGGDTVGSGFLVQLYDAAKELVHQENITSMIVQSAYIPNLKFNKEYSLVVLVYHCTSLGPPSDLYKVKIDSKGGQWDVPLGRNLPLSEGSRAGGSMTLGWVASERFYSQVIPYITSTMSEMSQPA